MSLLEESRLYTPIIFKTGIGDETKDFPSSFVNTSVETSKIIAIFNNLSLVSFAITFAAVSLFKVILVTTIPNFYYFFNVFKVVVGYSVNVNDKRAIQQNFSELEVNVAGEQLFHLIYTMSFISVHES